VNWLDAIERRAREAIGKPDEPKLVVRKPAAPLKIESFWVTLRNPNPNVPGDTGEIDAAFYYVADSVLTLCDQDGKPKGQLIQALGPNDDPRRIAGRLFKTHWAAHDSDFNRKLHYQRGSYA
jgi:hypothetical protein